jgi:hypothetical protein
MVDTLPDDVLGEIMMYVISPYPEDDENFCRGCWRPKYWELNGRLAKQLRRVSRRWDRVYVQRVMVPTMWREMWCFRPDHCLRQALREAQQRMKLGRGLIFIDKIRNDWVEFPYSDDSVTESESESE